MEPRSPVTRSLLLGSFALALAACGGGGGSGASAGGPPPAQPPVASTLVFPIDTAMQAFVNTGIQVGYAVSGTVQGVAVSGNGTLSQSAAVSGAFNGATGILDSAFSENDSVQVSNQVVTQTDVGHDYFNASGSPIGWSDTTSGEVAAATAPGVWPSAGKVGDSGTAATFTIWADATKASITGYERIDYHLEADTERSVFLVVTTVEMDALHSPTGSQTNRYRVDARGAMAWLSSQAHDTTPGHAGDLTLSFMGLTPGLVAPGWLTPNAPVTPLAAQNRTVAYQIDAAHTGHVVHGAALNLPATPTWSRMLPDGGTVSYPLVVGGRIFVLSAVTNPAPGSPYEQLWALDEATGSVSWGPVAIPANGNGGGRWAAHAYENGRIFVLSDLGQLLAFDALSGVQAWNLQLHNQPFFGAPPVAYGGGVYVVGNGAGQTLYSVDGGTGQLRWTGNMSGGASNSGIAVSNDGVFVNSAPNLTRFDTVTGAAAFTWTSGTNAVGTERATPVYWDGLVYYSDSSAAFSAQIVDAAFGGSGRGYTVGHVPAVTDAYVVTTLLNGTVVGQDAVTRNVLWNFTGDGQIVSAPIIVDTTVFVGSLSGNVYALDIATGALKWTGNSGATFTSVDPFANSASFLAAGEGYLVAPAGSILTAWKY